MTTLHSLSPAESIMEETTHPTATTDRHQKPTSDNGLHEEDAQVWAAFGDNFRNVQSMLDRNRALIQQVNENHQSKIADNMVKNVPLIQEINDNISKVAKIHILSLPFPPKNPHKQKDSFLHCDNIYSYPKIPLFLLSLSTQQRLFLFPLSHKTHKQQPFFSLSMFMDSLDTAGCFVDDLLDFALDICEDDDDEDLTTRKPSKPFSSLDPPPFHPLPEFAEEDLEWMLNKDAFPAVETFLGVGTLSTHHSPVSVLENSSNSTGSGGSSSGGGIIIMNYCGSMRVPVKARSKCLKRRRRDITAQQCWWSQENLKSAKPAAATIGRKCQHCGSEKTPQWRAGPLGPKTLCNACGVRYKSGRLVPEYRPASSPTFCSELHSNSHRKVLDMRRQKQMMGLVVAKPLEKG